MDGKQLNDALIKLIEKKNQLTEISYDDADYDDLEEEVHDLEDQFQEEFGSQLEEILADVHDEYCPDNDVLLPIAYIANHYKITENGNGKHYEVDYSEGVPVEADDVSAQIARLVILPNPARIILMTYKGKDEVVWSAE